MASLLSRVFILLVFACVAIQATHFRFGSISWAPVSNENYNIINVKLNLAFRTLYWSSGTVKLGAKISSGTGTIASGTGSTFAVPLVVNTINTVDGWFTGTADFQFTYPKGKNATYTIVYSGSARISTLYNNADKNWRLTSSVTINDKIINTSPVSNTYPIIPVITPGTNRFQIVATDQESSQLTYSLSEPSEFGGGVKCPNLTVSSDGWVTFTTGILPSLFNTQIKISDGTNFIVTDFILKSEKGSISSQPPYFISPTPDNGKVLNVQPGTNLTFTYAAKSDTSTQVFIKPSNVPLGVTQSPQSGLNPGTITNWWVPKVANVGRYVISLGLSDKEGLSMIGQRSFVIVVESPSCGNGKPCSGSDTSCCVCDPNWNATSKCFECNTGFYGPNCTKVPDCENGSSNDGVAGDGSCQCYSGWTGPTCNTPISQRCSAGDPSAVVSNSSTDSSYVNPTSLSVYVSTTSKTPFNVPFTISVPDPLPSLDVYLLLDVATKTSVIASDFINYIDSFVNLVGGNVENVRFGYGRFSDATTGGYNFQAVNTIGTVINDFVKTTTFTTTATTNQNSLVALYNAALNSNGWRQGSFRVILVVTDNDAAVPSTTNRDLYINTLTQNSIMPVVLGTGSATLTNWNSFITAAGFGYSASTGTGSSWASNAATLSSIRSYSKIVTRVTKDADSFATSDVADITTASNNKVNVPVLYPTTEPSSNPSVEVSFIGFGKTSMNILYNHPPTAIPSSINTNEDNAATFSLESLVSDPDFNILTVSFNSLPANGTIKSNNVEVDIGNSYPSNTSFTFAPSPNYFGSNSFSYSVSDGCLSSGSTGLITVVAVNDAPTCTAAGVTSYGGLTSSPFTVTGADIDTASSSLSIIFSSLVNIASYGTLKTVAGAAVVAGTKYAYGTQFTFSQTYNGADTSTTLPFVINDGSLPSSSCVLTINMKHSNVAPILSSLLSVTSNAGSNIQFNLTAEDSDSTSVQFSILSMTKGSGYFYPCSVANPTVNDQITNTGNYGSPVTISSGKSLFNSVCYHIDIAQGNGNGIAKIVFQSADNQGSKSNTITIAVNVAGTRTNNPPVATPVTVPALNEDGISVAIVLNGTDQDTPDQGNLRAVFTLPSNGIIVSADGTTPAASDGKAPYTVYYKPKALFYGSDSFTFYVYDTMGAYSSYVTISLTVNHVNHAPTLAAVTLSINQFSHPNQTLAPNDVDVGDTLNCYVVTLPSSGKVTDASGNVITSVASPALLANKQFSALESPLASITPYTTTFNAMCCDQVGACSSNTAMTIIYTYINQPPVPIQTNESCLQDGSVTFDFKYTDDKPGVSTIKLVTLPTNGDFYVNGDKVVSTTNAIPTTGVVYKPRPGLSNDDTPGFAGPLDTVPFNVIDADGLYSQSASTATFYVVPQKPPTYTGLNELNTNEDTPLNFIIEGLPPRGQSSFSLELVDLEGRGQLVYYVCDEPECLRTAKNGDTLHHDTKYAFTYVPLANDNGNAIYNVTFKLISEQQIASDDLTIVINVLPVNDAPIIILNDFIIVGVPSSNTPLTNTISFPMNQSIVMSWTGYDIDSPNNTLTCAIASMKRSSGNFYAYNATNADNGFIGEEIMKGSSIGTYDVNDKLWRVVFVPKDGAYGRGYAAFSFNLVDDLQLISLPSAITIDVESVNVAPFITLKQASFTGVEQSDIVVTGVSFRDPDSNVNNVSLVVSVVDANQELVSEASISFYGNVDKEFCVNETNKITCTEDQDTLNALIKTITVHNPTAGEIYLNIFVDDLGYNAPMAKRNVSHLTATDKVTLLVSSKPTSKTNNTTVLSAAIAGAVAGAAILVAGAWKFLKKSVPPTDAFFGDSPFADGAISANPLYQESGNAGVNPLYEASSEA